MKHLVSTLYHTDWDEFSKETIQSAKFVLLDTIAAMVAGIQQKECQQLLEELVGEDIGRFAIIGTCYKTSLYHSAFLHGTAGVATEMDEGNQYSKGHPAAHVVPVLITYVQKKENYSGKNFLSVLIKAYEACSRFGRATTLHSEAHAHGTWGVMGAAASTFLLENVSEEEMIEGLNISATFALPTMWNAALEGAMIRNIYAGHAIEMGIKSLSLLRTGHYAPKRNIEYVYSSILGSEFDETALIRQKDDLWDIEQNYYKPYAFCRYTHAPIDAFVSIIDQHQLSIDEITKVSVSTYSRAATLCNKEYHNALSAKFSIPYALAVWLKTKKADETIFTDELLKDKDIKEFANKVNVINSSTLEKDYPKVMPAVVEIETTSRKVYQERIDIAKGGPNKKLTEQELTTKFCKLTEEVFDRQQQELIIDWIMNIEEKQDMAELIELCQKRQ
ncbi:MmgE/PrpD family protein [Alkalihalobacillus sp. BA299]|uniref:MmgE/PrpD family protein n=1 Tax=Alkalihalobacillus sp. BA299 TaxID=2815938 RepID=UPI001ADC0BCF|nr:MmgE/PrpD family protein [Alkalihalobacillus sp. BA299]